MKKLIFAFIFLIVGTIATTAQDNNPVPGAKFKEVSHAFGNIPQGVPATTVFTYKNIGNTPLVIETATASCGCTTPEYPKTPVLAGKTGEIKVTYNAVATGNFTKMVTVKFANNQKPVLLKIEGNVVEKKTTASN
ncbi:MAG: DUF1573 domain-containing protein [Arachidicoccus sp.]|nr:DUF1573 domain-containing protein [Arachidicoccus sp.]